MAGRITVPVAADGCSLIPAGRQTRTLANASISSGTRDAGELPGDDRAGAGEGAVEPEAIAEVHAVQLHRRAARVVQPVRERVAPLRAL